uniref:Hypotheticial protein n=1 Tax=Schistosoma japonicum TaxID=6182 RepID=C1LYL4_SCHJA|nr:hypotheticial protein [Schistosoma japonicum]
MKPSMEEIKALFDIADIDKSGNTFIKRSEKNT